MQIARLLGLTACLLMADVAGGEARAETWRLNSDYAEVRFSWDNLGLSRQSARFTEVEGTLHFTPTDPEGAWVEVRIPTASLNSGAPKFDELLRRSEFFAASDHPYIIFKSSKVDKSGERTARMVGDLTIRDATHPVTLDVVWNFTGPHPLATVNPAYDGQWVSGFSATGAVKRSDWGLDRGLPLVSDEVRISIEVEFLLDRG